jgi:tetratricopeptide (TPR) repeat protein
MMASSQMQAQDLYDLEHSRRFAHFLYSSGQFAEAAREYERVLFLDSSGSDIRIPLVRAYRFSGQNEKALSRLGDLSQGFVFGLSEPLGREYALNHLSMSNYPEARSFLDSALGFSPYMRSELYLGSFLLQADWAMARAFALSNGSAGSVDYLEMIRILESAEALKYRSPALAIGMSALVPGLGKVYAGAWQDGLMSLLFVASNAWQSYRGFNSDGISSPYGWAFGALAIGFYAGNLYGTAQSVKRYNHGLDEVLLDRTRHLLFDPN